LGWTCGFGVTTGGNGFGGGGAGGVDGAGCGGAGSSLTSVIGTGSDRAGLDDAAPASISATTATMPSSARIASAKARLGKWRKFINIAAFIDYRRCGSQGRVR
jgi:hypothetical protein